MVGFAGRAHLDLQAPRGSEISQRQGLFLRRRGLHLQAPARREDGIGRPGRAGVSRSERHQGPRSHHGHLHDDQARRRAADPDFEQVHQYRPGRSDPGEASTARRRHRTVHAGAVHAQRSGAHPAQESELLERRTTQGRLPENYRGAGGGGRRLGPQGRTGRPDAERRSVGHSRRSRTIPTCSFWRPEPPTR